MSRLAHFNSLPSRTEYIKRVLSTLDGGSSYTLMELQRKTKLTRTQVACTLDDLLSKGEVSSTRLDGKVVYTLQK